MRRAVVVAAVAVAPLWTACTSAAPADGVPAVEWSRSHDDALARAKAEHRPALIEFTADWCVPCQELEERTYPDRQVRQQAERFVMVRVDATDPDDDTAALMKRYRVYGLPTIVFIDSAGALLETPRVTGFVEPARFAYLMSTVH